MQTGIKKTALFFTALAVIIFLTGCTNWKKKYASLDVEHQNLKGLYENCASIVEQSSGEKSQLGHRINREQGTIAELRKQLDDMKRSARQGYGGDSYVTWVLENKILFDPGRAVLKKTSFGELNKIVSELKTKYSSKEVDVIGHTDSDPIKKSKWKDNWELSSERALAVVRYFNSKGVSDKKLRAVGCGQGRPVASNKTASGKAKNRRVEVVVAK